MARCLYCYEELQPCEPMFHLKCTRRVFSLAVPPTLPYTSAEIASHAGARVAVDKGSNELRFVDERGSYTLLSNDGDEVVAQLEAVVMRMADLARVAVVPHTLVRSVDGGFHHLCGVLDYAKKGVCIELQNIEVQEDNGKYEDVAEGLKKLSTTPKLDIINLYERLLFCYIIGDIKLGSQSFVVAKNGCGSSLAPASRLFPHALLSTDNEMALTLNGKRSDFTHEDFECAMMQGGLESKIIENMFAKFERSIDLWCDLIDLSPLPESLRESLKLQMVIRFDALG